MNQTRRPHLFLAAALFACALILTAAQTARAHPLGNFTVNHHTGLTFHPSRIDAEVVVDRAEIAAAQERPAVDRNHDGRIDAGEARSYARKSCAELAGQLRVSIGHRQLTWTIVRTALTHPPGEAGLKTSRLQCTLTSAIRMPLPAEVDVHTAYDSRRIGWREITARGEDLRVSNSDVPATSSTDELRRYPADPPADRLDQTSARMRIDAGSTTPAANVDSALSKAGPVGDVLGRVTGFFDSLVGSRDLTLPVGLLALLLAVVLGASHATLPGHGKTLMAAYLAGRRGTPRDAVTVGATVTFTHTAGVLALGIALPMTTHLAGETVLTWLGLTSGLIVTTIGLWLLRCALLNKPTPHSRHHHHAHPHHHAHDHSHHDDDPHEAHRHHPEPNAGRPPHTQGPVHQLPVPMTRGHRDFAERDAGSLLTAPRRDTAGTAKHHPGADIPDTAKTKVNRTSLIGMGIAGGLVPSPTALVILLGAIALGRTAFGVLLVLAYGLGMAATLTLAGLLLVHLRDRIETRLRATTATGRKALTHIARHGPVGTSLLVLIVGLGLTLRAAAGPW